MLPGPLLRASGLRSCQGDLWPRWAHAGCTMRADGIVLTQPCVDDDISLGVAANCSALRSAVCRRTAWHRHSKGGPEQVVIGAGSDPSEPALERCRSEPMHAVRTNADRRAALRQPRRERLQIIGSAPVMRPALTRRDCHVSSSSTVSSFWRCRLLSWS